VTFNIELFRAIDNAHRSLTQGGDDTILIPDKFRLDSS
jgi:hypothetical protein